MTISLSELIELLPQVLMLVLPGYVFLLAYNLCASCERPLLISAQTIIISYIIKVITNIVIQATAIQVPELIVVLISLVFSSFAGLGLGKLISIQSIDEWFGRHFRKTFSNNPWYTLPDRKLGSYVRVYLKDESVVYEGALTRQFLYEHVTWIALQEYKVISGTPPLNDGVAKSIDYHTLLINTSGVNRVEFYYNAASELRRKPRVH